MVKVCLNLIYLKCACIEVVMYSPDFYKFQLLSVKSRLSVKTFDFKASIVEVINNYDSEERNWLDFGMGVALYKEI